MTDDDDPTSMTGWQSLPGTDKPHPDTARGLSRPRPSEPMARDNQDLRARLATVEKERDEARESEGRLLARREPLDPSGYSLADAEFILMDHHRGMSIEDRAESLKRIGEIESHALRSALLSAERDWRDALRERDEARADLATYREQSGALCSRLMYERDQARAECERLKQGERDRADALVEAIETTAEKIAAFLDDDRMSNHDDHTPSWIALTNAVRWIRDGLWRGQAHKSTAEQIAQWLDAKAAKLEATLASIPDNKHNREQRDEFGWGASYTSGAAADIRAGKWRTP